MKNLKLLIGVMILWPALASANSEITRLKTTTDTVGQPSDAGVGTRFNSEFSLQAGDAESKAKLALTKFLSISDGKYRRLQLDISTPFDSDKQEQIDVGTLSGLTAGTSMSIEIGFLRWPTFTQQQSDRYKKLCEKYFTDLIPGFTWNQISIGGSGSAGGLVCTAANTTLKTVNSAIDNIKVKQAECLKTPGGQYCGLLNETPTPSLAADSETILKNFKQGFLGIEASENTRISNFSIGLKANRQKFDFVQSTTPTSAEKATKKGWGITAAYTRIGQGSLWSAGYSHEVSYKGGKKTQVCSPIEMTTSLTCKDAALGAPKRDDGEILFVEYRKSYQSKFGVSPRIEFDLHDSEWAIGVPVYLVSNENGQFTSGLKLGWDEEDDFGVSLFVGKPFKFFD